MPWKPTLVSAIECQRVANQVMTQYRFLRPPIVRIQRFSMDVKGFLESGDSFELHVNRLTGAGIDSPRITPSDSSILPPRYRMDFSSSTNGKMRDPQRNS